MHTLYIESSCTDPAAQADAPVGVVLCRGLWSPQTPFAGFPYGPSALVSILRVCVCVSAFVLVCLCLCVCVCVRQVWSPEDTAKRSARLGQDVTLAKTRA
jgi:hypothetical protein